MSHPNDPEKKSPLPNSRDQDCSNIHVSREILLTKLEKCQKQKNTQLLCELEWELVSLGANAPIEELLQMLIECEDFLQAYYQPFFTQVGHILGLLSEWVTPERLLASSNGEYDSRLNLGEDQCAAISILGALKDFVPTTPKLLMSVLEDSLQKRDVRAHTIFTLEEIEENIPLPYLLLGLDWCYQGMIETTVEIMTRLGEQAPLQELFALLDDDNNWTSSSATWALCNLVQYVPVSLLVNAVTHGSAQMRENAVRIMAACSDRAPVSFLIQVARNKNEIPAVRGEAWKTLARLGRRVPLEIFVEMAQDEQEFIWNNGMYALITRGESATLDELPLLLQILVTDADLRHTLLEIINTFEGQGPIKLLMYIIQDKQLYTSIMQKTSRLFNPMQAAIEARTVPSAFAALVMLSRYVSLDRLIANLDDYQADWPGNSIEALIIIGQYDSLEAVIAHLHTMEENRLTVIDIVGMLGENTPLDALIEALLYLLDDQDDNVQFFARRRLYKFAEANPAKVIARIASDTRYLARLVLFKALEHAGVDAPEEMIALTKELLFDKELFGHALQTLNTSGKSSEIPPDFLLQALQGDLQRWIVLEALEQFGPEVPLDALLPLLGDRSKSLCGAAARTIAKTHPEAIQSVILPQIEAVLQDKPTSEIFAASVQRRIAYRIGWMEHVSPPLITKLIELLDYPYVQVRLETVRSLGKIHPTLPDSALLRLTELRSDPHSQTLREAADTTLAAIRSVQS